MLQPGAPVKLLNTVAEKEKLLELLGLDNLIIQNFNAEFANLSAEEFVSEVLVKSFHLKKIIIGHDHRFGKGRSADIHDLLVIWKKICF